MSKTRTRSIDARSSTPRSRSKNRGRCRTETDAPWFGIRGATRGRSPRTADGSCPSRAALRTFGPGVEMTSIAFGLMAAIAGAATVIQSAANAGLAARIGLAPALLVNTAIVLLGALAFYFSRGPHQIFFAAGTPWTLYVGGVCGFLVIL